MKGFQSLTRTACCIALGGSVFIFSCKKTKDVVAKPTVAAAENGGKDSTTVGDTLLLHPAVANPSGATYQWTVNDQAVSTDSAYPFIPGVRGDYAIVYTVSNAGGASSVNYQVHVYGKYENGFFLVNEGWFGHGGGTVGFYRFGTGTIEDSVFEKTNPGKDFGGNATSMEFGTVYGNKLYLLTKAGGPLVAADAFSLVETGRVAENGSNDFRAMIGIDSAQGLVSTGAGLRPLTLASMAVGAPVSTVTGEVGDLAQSGSHVFALSGSDGVDVLNAADLSIAKSIPGLVVGFTTTTDGAVWAAGDSMLVRIDGTTLDTTAVKLPFEVNGTFGFWHAGSIVATTAGDAVFIAYNGPYSGATTIYKYVVGTPGSVATPFITLDAGKELYGKGLAINPANGQLIVTTVKSGYGENYSVNDLDFYDTGTGSKVADHGYTGYFFPALPVFH